ncbi:MAG: hypothetical protein ACJ74O_12725 [Frankiaceae bacterium]
MPLMLSAIDASELAGFLTHARAQLAGSPAAVAVAAAAEPVETRMLLARMMSELSAPPRADGKVELRVVDDDAFLSAVRHLRGLMAWFAALRDRGDVILRDLDRPTRLVDRMLDYVQRLHRMREALRHGH